MLRRNSTQVSLWGCSAFRTHCWRCPILPSTTAGSLKGQGPQHPDPTGFHTSCFWIPLGCSAQLQRAPKAVEPAQSQALLRAGQLCALPAALCTPQRAAGTRTSQERSPWMRQHMWQQRWSHSDLLRYRRAVTLPTHPHPLWPQPSARPRAAGKGGSP